MRQKAKIIIFVLSFALVILHGAPAFAANSMDDTYTYDFWGMAVKSVPAFELTRTINEKSLDVTVQGFNDVCAGKDRVFLIDTVESRLEVLDADFNLITSVKLIRNADKKIVTDPDTGNQLILTNPEGVWYHEPMDEIYIADTGASRIIVLDGTGYYLKRMIERPDNMIGSTQFNPSKIVVDQANKIYFVVQSGFEGIVELNESGSFSRYFGVNKPVVNFWDYFWKTLSSDTQKSKMAKTYAPSFNNIDVDDQGFIYATTIDSAAQEMVFRLNPKGENVLRQEGSLTVTGDLPFNMNSGPSAFTDIAINDYGVYALLDQSKGRIFLYDFDGNLINIFASSGDLKGDFRAPSAIAWFGDKLIATDKTLRCAYVYEMTDFGKAALGAAKHYYAGEWEEAARLAEEAIHLNANYDVAYVNLGKYYLMKDDFKAAMHYFNLGNDRKFYSQAYNGYRNIWVRDHFIWILLVFLLAAGALIYSEFRYHRRKG
ncbi:hypothetical protein HNQ56_002951 [Anaerotaenia torta]|uniref:hypothetical protein n=1 Tax=Anaerotaenia torta TaxID=433293 RepID=UPI003D1C3825